jgi:2-amino-4-hydroxy-6-hydroxymethyldihydropteridine diphosphokinase
MKVTAYIGLGANLDDPAAQVEYALAELDRLPATALATRSSLYATAPVGYVDQPDFINAVARIETALAPRALLVALLDIEHRHGRQRSFRNAPRTLDLDLLLYGAAHFHEQGLTLPHPRMTERAFVLLPLTEIAPELDIPGRGRAADWISACADQSVAPIHLPKPAVAALPFPADETTSHSTRQAKDASQVAGYPGRRGGKRSAQTDGFAPPPQPSPASGRGGER